MILGSLSASLLRNMLADKEVRTTSRGQKVIRADEGTIKVGQDF